MFARYAKYLYGILLMLVLAATLLALFLPAVGKSEFKYSIKQAMVSPASVKKLALMNQVLTQFPEEIKQFPNLERLILTGNKTVKLPDWISQNKKLEYLWLNDFNLEPFPMALLDLQQLEDLRLENCGITEIPPGIANLKALRILELEGNPLPQEEIDKAQNLLPNVHFK